MNNIFGGTQNSSASPSSSPSRSQQVGNVPMTPALGGQGTNINFFGDDVISNNDASFMADDKS